MRTTGGGRRTDPAKSGEKIRARGRGVAKSRRSAREKKTRKMHCTCTHAPLPNFWPVPASGSQVAKSEYNPPLQSAKVCQVGAARLWQPRVGALEWRIEIWQPGSDWPALARDLARFVRASGTRPPSLQACPNCRSCARLEPTPECVGVTEAQPSPRHFAL